MTPSNVQLNKWPDSNKAFMAPKEMYHCLEDDNGYVKLNQS